jgi:hypothetical protein
MTGDWAMPYRLSILHPNIFSRLAETLADGVGEFGRRFQLLGNRMLIVLPCLAGTFAVILGMVVVVLDPMVEQFGQFIREGQGNAGMGMIVIMMMVVMVRHAMTPEFWVTNPWRPAI